MLFMKMDLLNYQYLDKMNNNIGILCYEGAMLYPGDRHRPQHRGGILDYDAQLTLPGCIIALKPVAGPGSQTVVLFREDAPENSREGGLVEMPVHQESSQGSRELLFKYRFLFALFLSPLIFLDLEKFADMNIGPHPASTATCIAALSPGSGEAALRGEPRLQTLPVASALTSHRTGPPPISPSKRKFSVEPGDDDLDCESDHATKMSRIFAPHLHPKRSHKASQANGATLVPLLLCWGTDGLPQAGLREPSLSPAKRIPALALLSQQGCGGGKPFPGF
ncbi:hypothetical protein CB1_000465002 [Camelus ferus]|nr:hypothetical protein CB1_000465002 [Camelus ferus]